MDEGQPILGLFAPSDTDAASSTEPTQGTFDDPAAGRITQLPGDRTLFDFGLVSHSPMLDMRNVLLLFNDLMNIVVIVAFVSTQMLLDLLRIRPFNHDGDDEVVRRPLVMLVGCADVNREWGTMLVNQQVDLATTFAPVGRVPARFSASKRCWTRFAVNRLPCPANRLLAGIEQGHLDHHGFKDAQLSPGLEPFMQGAATHSEPVPMNSLPLTARPQHIPDAIQDAAVIGARSPWLTGFSWLWQQFLDLLPQRIRHLEVVYVFRLCVSILAQDVSSLEAILINLLSNEVRPFVQPGLIYG